MGRKWKLFTGSCAAALVATSIAAWSDDIAKGRTVAQARCGRCHAVGANGESPQIGLIAFRQLSERFPVEMLTDALATGDIGGHDEMPMFTLGRADVRNLVAYIDSLSPSGPRYLDAKR